MRGHTHDEIKVGSLGVLKPRPQVLIVFCHDPAMQTWLRNVVEDAARVKLFGEGIRLIEWYKRHGGGLD